MVEIDVDVWGDWTVQRELEIYDAVESHHGNITIWNHFIAGWIGGSAGIIVGHPMDTVKVQMQTTKGLTSIRKAVSTVHSFGWTHGFFRGLAFPLASQGIVCATFFAGYGYSSHFLRVTYPEIPEGARAFLAGCVGGAVQLIPCCQTEIIKVNLQARLSPNCARYFTGPFDCLRSIYRESGIKGSFRGIYVHGFRDIFGYGIYSSTEVCFIEAWHLSDPASKDPLSLGSFIGGGLAGSVSWFVITPFDVIKSRVQSNNFKFKGAAEFCRFIANIARTEGIRAFFKGSLLSVLRAFPVNTVTLPLYHFCEQGLKDIV